MFTAAVNMFSNFINSINNIIVKNL